jgi:hypothetical protein
MTYQSDRYIAIQPLPPGDVLLIWTETAKVVLNKARNVLDHRAFGLRINFASGEAHDTAHD